MVSSSILLLICAVLLLESAAQAASHTFQPNEPVKLYANKVGPFSNPRYRRLGQRLWATGICMPLLMKQRLTATALVQRDVPILRSALLPNT